MWNAIKTTISNAVSSVQKRLSSAWNAIKSGVSSAWNSVKTSISNAWNNIKTIVSNAVSSVSEIIRKWGDTLFNLGKAAIQGLINGIKSMASAVGSAVGGLLKRAYEEGKKAIKSKSPSKLFADLGISGGDGIIQGFRDREGNLQSQMERMKDIMEKTMRRAQKGVGEISRNTALKFNADLNRQVSGSNRAMNRLRSLKNMARADQAGLRRDMLEMNLARRSGSETRMKSAMSNYRQSQHLQSVMERRDDMMQQSPHRRQVTSGARGEASSSRGGDTLRVDVYVHGDAAGLSRENALEIGSALGKGISDRRRRGGR